MQSGGYSHQIASIAARQGGYVRREQLRGLGLTDNAIAHRIARGTLIHQFHAVYAVGHVPTASLARAHAPLLAVGARCALAGWSAVNAYTNAARWVEPFTLITPLQSQLGGVKLMHSARLRSSDIRSIHGLRTVSPALAILHVAPDLSAKRMIRLIDDFRINQHLTHAELERATRRFPRHARPLKSVLDTLQAEPTRSKWEQEWPAFAERHDLPPYAMNVHVLTCRVDVLFDGLIVMLDGWNVHGSRHAFEHDREEMAEIMAVTGLPTLRITYRQFHDHPGRQADRIKVIVARRAT